MQISLKWINELVKIEKDELDNLIEKLTLGGFEVEKILEIEVENRKEIVLDISATANRSDSLSVQGISKEISSLLNQPVKITNQSLKIQEWKESIETLSQTFSTNVGCSMIVSVIIENLLDTTVPKWITQKLISSGFICSSTLVDFQNYILLETGYPFAFYDVDKICSKLKTSKFDLLIRKIENNQEFLASNDKIYELNNSILTINANDLPIGIGGIIESKDFSSTGNTTNLLIEGSIFNGPKIRQQSRNLGVRTDRSARYEKALKSTYLIEALYRLISLLRISNPNLICKLNTINKTIEPSFNPILLRYKSVNEILGPIISPKSTICYVSPEVIKSYLNRLNFQFIYNEVLLTWKVMISSERTEDLTREIDLIEEIGRLHGFNNFLTTLPKVKTIGTEDAISKTRQKVTTCLLNLGFNELIHYSLVNQETFLDNQVKLINPLVSEYSSLRASLLPNLIKTVQQNLKQKNVSLEGFEYGHVFYTDSKNNFQEKEYVAGIFGGIKTKLAWSELEISITWFEAKGKIEQLFNQLNLLVYWQNCSVQKLTSILHPYKSAELCLANGTSLGKFGQINSILANKLNISSEMYLFELDLTIIQSQLHKTKLAVYKEYANYPRIIKDLSFIVRKNIPFNEIKDHLYNNGTEFLLKINLLDEYQGSSIPKESKSLCLQLVFQSSKKTLENKIIENIVTKLQFILIKKFDVIIRT